MFCFTSKAALAAVVVAFSLDGGLPLPSNPGTAPAAAPLQPEQALPREAQFLEIESEGYSRFEIDGDEIVARFSGGVDFKYMGYHGRANELVYHHAGQQAIASGDVRFDLGDVQLTSTEANLDVIAGTAALGETVYARMQERGLFLEAKYANLTFTPGQPPERLAEVQAELSGGVHAYSTLGSWLVTDALKLDGPKGKLATTGAFILALSSEQLSDAQREAGIEWGATRLTGAAAEFTFTQEGLVDTANIDEFRLINDLGELSAAHARLTQTGSSEEPVWDVSLTGEPIAGKYVSGEQQAELACQELSGVFKPDGSLTGHLDGDVNLTTASQHFTGEVIAFAIDSAGLWHVDIPENFVLNFQLAEEPLELGALPGLGGE